MKLLDLSKQSNIYLYAGTMPRNRRKDLPFVGLCLDSRPKAYHVHHDITQPMSDLPDNSVDVYQSEDVMEHIEFDKLPQTINEIYRVLKPGGLFRFSVPDYRCDFLIKRCTKNSAGEIVFDPQGGGRYDKYRDRVTGGGHVWFPTYEKVMDLFEENTEFSNITVLHAYTKSRFVEADNVTQDEFVCRPIDYSKGFVARTPDHDKRVQTPRRPLSLVVDLVK